ncbi:MAG: Uma2 family endonuclease, partial [Candidatus Eremiobacterota bacterium]
MLDLSEDHVWTYEDYCRLPDDGKSYEVIDGKLLVSPAPRSFHQVVSRRIQFVLYQALELTGKGFVFNAPIHLLMQGCSPVQPDLVYLERAQRG